MARAKSEPSGAGATAVADEKQSDEKITFGELMPKTVFSFCHLKHMTYQVLRDDKYLDYRDGCIYPGKDMKQLPVIVHA